MSTTSYYVEFAKSGRSKCKKCKDTIAKDTIRIIVEVEGVGSYTMSSNYHVSCFGIPKQYKDQSATYFVQNILHDKSIHDGTAAVGGGGRKSGVLPDHENEIIAAIEISSSKSSKKRKSIDGDATATNGSSVNDTAGTTPITQLKRAYHARCLATQKGNKPSSSSWSNQSSENIINHSQKPHPPSSSLLDMIDLYGLYHKYTIDELKDILRQNRQYMTGTKDILLYKVIDGCNFNGRITFCPLCITGKLKLVFVDTPTNPVVTTAVIKCNGTFDEMIQRRMECSYTCSPCNAVRHTPFYSQSKPSDIENTRMDEYEEAMKEGTTPPTATTTTVTNNSRSTTGKNSKNNSKSKKNNDADNAKSRMIEYWQGRVILELDWNLSSRNGIRAATAGLIEILLSPLPSDKTNGNNNNDTSLLLRLDIPTDVNDALQSVGPVIATNKQLSPPEMIDILVRKYGWYTDRVEKEQQKQNTIAQIVQHPDNVSLVMVLRELSELYFQTGSSNAGVCYRKVMTAVQTLPYAVTIHNAKQLGSGKQKVPNIGKSSAEKIYEYVTTGTIQKLIEKRAEAA